MVKFLLVRAFFLSMFFVAGNLWTGVSPSVAQPVQGLPQSGLPAEILAIQHQQERHQLFVEVARTAHQRELGLMFRKSLQKNRGMLFLYSDERIRTMWMRNTIVPLDMIFINSAGRITHIVRDTVPFSDKEISSGAPVRAVLELFAGTVANWNLEPGDQVFHPVFDTSAYLAPPAPSAALAVPPIASDN